MRRHAAHAVARTGKSSREADPEHGGDLQVEQRDRWAERRTIAQVSIAVVVAVAALQIARALFVPIILGVLVSYTMEPPVNFLVARRVPRPVAAIVVFFTVVCLLAMGAFALRRQAEATIARLPDAAAQLRAALDQHRRSVDGPLTQMQRAADELRQLPGGAVPRQSPKPPPVPIDRQPFQISDYLWSSSLTLTGFVGDVLVVLLLAFYLLLAGDLFRRRAIEIAGPTLSQRKITLQILDDINAQIARYLAIRTLISVTVGIGTAVAFAAIGLSQPGIWGVAAGLLNVIPFVGPLMITVGAALAAFVQFQTLTMGVVAAGVATIVACLEAYAVTPWLTSRGGDMNPAVVFIGLVFWGWLWGLPGLLLAVPMMMILKAVAEHVEGLQSVAVLLRK
jgi:predicted PurR-regulated permease PerM